MNKPELGIPCRIWRQGLAGNPDRPCLRPEKYAGRVDFKRYESLGVRLLIPLLNLFGTQTRPEYDNRKRNGVERRFQTCGVNCLKEHPAIVCALPGNIELTLAILDGHHRTRYAPLFEIALIPSLIYTPAQLVDILNQHQVYGRRIDENFLVADLTKAVGAALSSFERALPNHKHPRTTPVNNINELTKLYQPF